MTHFKATLTLCAILAGTTAFAAQAPSVAAQVYSGEMPSRYYDELNAKLIAAGYSQVHVLDAESHKLWARHPNGGIVHLIAHPSERRIVSETFTHPAER